MAGKEHNVFGKPITNEMEKIFYIPGYNTEVLDEPSSSGTDEDLEETPSMQVTLDMLAEAYSHGSDSTDEQESTMDDGPSAGRLQGSDHSLTYLQGSASSPSYLHAEVDEHKHVVFGKGISDRMESIFYIPGYNTEIIDEPSSSESENGGEIQSVQTALDMLTEANLIASESEDSTDEHECLLKPDSDRAKAKDSTPKVAVVAPMRRVEKNTTDAESHQDDGSVFSSTSIESQSSSLEGIQAEPGAAESRNQPNDTAVRLWKNFQPIMERLQLTAIVPLLFSTNVINSSEWKNHCDDQDPTKSLLYLILRKGINNNEVLEHFMAALRQTHKDLWQQTESTQVTENDRNRFFLSDLEDGSSQQVLLQKDTASVLRIRLCDYYQHQLSIVHPVEWNLDVKMNIREIYVEPQFQDITYQPQADPSSGNYGAFAKQQSPLQNMQHLLDASKDGPSPRRILLQGPSGIGKTTILQKIALDWAQRTDSPIFNKFDQVLHFPVGTFSGNVPEAIRNNILADDEGTLSVKSLMSLFLDTEFQTKTLFLIDGYDDIPENDRTLISDIWLGKKLRNCTVILTNNTGLPNHLSKATEKICLLTGLSSENQDNYISKYSQANQISLSKPQSQGIFSQLSHNPLYLSFLCLIMEEHQGILPKTRVELLQTVVDLVTERAAMKLKTPVDCLTSELDKLYIVAFDCLVKGTMLVPPDAVLLHSRLVASGILVQTKGPSKLRPSTTYRFTHTIFQEFFTAKYLAQLPFAVLKSKTAQLDLNQKMTIYVYLTGILAKEHDHSLLRDTFKLITQDLKAEGQYLNDEWSFDTEYLNRHNPAHLIPDCLCETGHVQDLGPVIAEVLPKWFAYLNESCGTCFRGILLASNYYELNTKLLLFNQHISLELLDLGESFPNIRSVVIAINYLDMFHLLQHTFPAISELTVIIPLTIIYPVSASYEKLSALLQSKQTVLKSLTIGDIRLGDTGESDLLRILLQMAGESLQQLYMRDFTLDHASAEEIVQAITRCNNLKGISFQKITCPEADFAKIMSATMRCHHLMDISLKSVCVTKTGQHTPHGARSDIRPPLPESAYSLLKKEGLRSLIINQQRLSAKLLLFNSCIIQRLLLAAIEWPKGIPKSILKILSNTKLEELSLPDQNISHSHPRGIEDIVCKVTNIHWLDISGNQIEKQSFSAICRHLTNALNLTELFLSHCNITDESIFYLSPILGRNKITILYLDGNSISLHLITQLVTQGKSLEELAVTVQTSDFHIIEEIKNALTCNHSSMDVLHLLLPCDEGFPLLPETVMRGVSYKVQVHLVPSVYEMLDNDSKYIKKLYEWEKIMYN